MLADRIRMCIGKLRRLIDRTTPTIVVNQPFSTKGNGGRKLVRMDDGTLVTIVSQSTGSLLYKSVDNGLTWNLLKNIGYNATDTAIVAKGDNIYVVYTYGYGIFMRAYSKEGILVNSTTIDSGQLEVTRCSLALNKENNELHACWTSKNAKYPNNFNIRYCKGEVQSSGAIIWDNVEEVTSANELNYHFEYVSIIVDNNNYPLISIIYREDYGYSVRAIGKYESLPSSGAYVNYPWNLAVVFPYTTKSKSDTCICIDKDGGIHLTWQDNTIEGQPRIRYSKSINNGRTWSTSITIESASTSYQRPSISVNSNNELFIGLTRGGWIYMYKSTDYGNTWKIVDEFVNIMYGDNIQLLADHTVNFNIPPNISMTGQFTPSYPSSVIFSGKWYE